MYSTQIFGLDSILISRSDYILVSPVVIVPTAKIGVVRVVCMVTISL